MANIARLAVMIEANMNNLTRGVQDASTSINNIAKAAQNSTPSIKNLKDSLQALDMMENMKRNNAEVEGLGDSINKVRESVTRMAQGVPDDILKMQPTMENAMKARQEVERLREVAAEAAL